MMNEWKRRRENGSVDNGGREKRSRGGRGRRDK